MAFSATEAAFEGFRLMRRSPGAVVIWGLLHLLLFGVLIAMFVATLSPLWALGENPDPDQVATAFQRMWPMMLLALPVLLLGGVVFYAAVFRAVLEPAESRGAFLRFGAAEMRLLLAYLLLIVIWVAFVAGCVAVITGVTVVTPEALRWLPIFLLVTAALCVAVWGGVRLSLVLPMSFAEHGVPIGEAWVLTRGRFWPLLGAYLLAFALSIAVSMVLGTVGMILFTLLGGVSLFTQMEAPQPAVFTPLFIVGGLLYLVTQIASAVVQAVLMAAPAASAYRQLRGPTGEHEVFA